MEEEGNENRVFTYFPGYLHIKYIIYGIKKDYSTNGLFSLRYNCRIRFRNGSYEPPKTMR